MGLEGRDSRALISVQNYATYADSVNCVFCTIELSCSSILYPPMHYATAILHLVD